jgi:transmembrane sensor
MEAERSSVTAIAEQANQWLHRLHAADLRQDEREAFVEWLRQSPLHVREVLIAFSLDDVLQRARIRVADSTLHEDRASNIIELSVLPPSDRSRRSHRPWRMAACIALLASAALLFAGLRAVYLDRTIETVASEWKSVTLTDGSELTLAPRSKVAIEFGDRLRTLRLARGEAYFYVAKDTTARPFLVEADSFRVRATGTSFAVARREDGLLVTVEKGSVLVSRSSPPLSVRVSDDEQLTVSANGDPVPEAVDSSHELAWVDRRLTFDGTTTLGEAVAAFNRLNELQLRVEDRVLSAQPVRGTFAADDPRSFAEVIEQSSAARLKVERGVLQILPQGQSGRPDERG